MKRSAWTRKSKSTNEEMKTTNTYCFNESSVTAQEMGYADGISGRDYSLQKVDDEDRDDYTAGFNMGDKTFNTTNRR